MLAAVLLVLCCCFGLGVLSLWWLLVRHPAVLFSAACRAAGLGRLHTYGTRGSPPVKKASLFSRSYASVLHVRYCSPSGAVAVACDVNPECCPCVNLFRRTIALKLKTLDISVDLVRLLSSSPQSASPQGSPDRVPQVSSSSSSPPPHLPPSSTKRHSKPSSTTTATTNTTTTKHGRRRCGRMFSRLLAAFWRTVIRRIARCLEVHVDRGQACADLVWQTDDGQKRNLVGILMPGTLSFGNSLLSLSQDSVSGVSPCINSASSSFFDCTMDSFKLDLLSSCPSLVVGGSLVIRFGDIKCTLSPTELDSSGGHTHPLFECKLGHCIDALFVKWCPKLLIVGGKGDQIVRSILETYPDSTRTLGRRPILQLLHGKTCSVELMKHTGWHNILSADSPSIDVFSEHNEISLSITSSGCVTPLNLSSALAISELWTTFFLYLTPSSVHTTTPDGDQMPPKSPPSGKSRKCHIRFMTLNWRLEGNSICTAQFKPLDLTVNSTEVEISHGFVELCSPGHSNGLICYLTSNTTRFLPTDNSFDILQDLLKPLKEIHQAMSWPCRKLVGQKVGMYAHSVVEWLLLPEVGPVVPATALGKIVGINSILPRLFACLGNALCTLIVNNSSSFDLPNSKLFSILLQKATVVDGQPLLTPLTVPAFRPKQILGYRRPNDLLPADKASVSSMVALLGDMLCACVITLKTVIQKLQARPQPETPPIDTDLEDLELVNKFYCILDSVLSSNLTNQEVRRLTKRLKQEWFKKLFSPFHLPKATASPTNNAAKRLVDCMMYSILRCAGSPTEFLDQFHMAASFVNSELWDKETRKPRQIP
ncbi:hypothetical protein Pelo_14346 [Pelomyxa schiedti]|nr:hypothetical protein Pelo_14346 [Pelomyxa schiedti]